MIIRAYNKSEQDLADVMALLEELRGSKEAERFSFYLQDSNTYKTSYLVSKGYYRLVALVDGKIAGFIIGEHYLNDTVNLVMLYVGKEYRKQGIAFELKKVLTHLAQAWGYKKIVSQVRMNNIESINLNLKAGWHQEIDKVHPDYYYWFTKELIQLRNYD